MRFKKRLKQPGARRSRTGHHHGSDTPTSPRAIYVLKSAKCNEIMPSVQNKYFVLKSKTSTLELDTDVSLVNSKNRKQSTRLKRCVDISERSGGSRKRLSRRRGHNQDKCSLPPHLAKATLSNLDTNTMARITTLYQNKVLHSVSVYKKRWEISTSAILQHKILVS